MSADRNIAETIQDILIAADPLLEINGSPPVAVVPPNYATRVYEGLLSAPVRQRGTVTMDSLDSLARYVKSKASPTTIEVAAKLADLDLTKAVTSAGTIVVILNPGNEDNPSWQDWRVTHDMRFSREFKDWWAKSGVAMTQKDIAEFFEDSAFDFVKPAASDMVALAKRFQATRNVQFGQAVDLQSGAVELQFTEKVGANGVLEIPNEFTIAIPIFHNDPVRTALRARLRYRVPQEPGGLTMWFDLIRPEFVVEHVVQEALDKLGTELLATEKKPLLGVIPEVAPLK